MVLALTVCGLVVALVVVGLFVFGLRRRLIQRSGGTFDCSLRWDVPEKSDPNGKGWGYGVARYNGDRIEWYRVFSYSPARAASWNVRRSRWPAAAPRTARRNSPCSPTRSSWPASTGAPVWNWR